MTNLNPIKKKLSKVDRKISIQDSSKLLAEFFTRDSSAIIFSYLLSIIIGFHDFDSSGFNSDGFVIRST